MGYTKGEWEIMPYTRRDGDNIRWVKAVRGKRRVAICQTFRPCAEANARLIAAAPKLLDACEKARDWADDSAWAGREEIVIMLEAAIALAKG